jgi:two-component system, response regulator PdtaR
LQRAILLESISLYAVRYGVSNSLPVHRLTQACTLPVFAGDDSVRADEESAEPVRIMIVEDDFLVASEIEQTLIEAGYEVVGVAVSAADAIQIAATRSPTLAVMDIRLVGPRDGIDVALELFGTHGIRCIFATAHQTQQARERARPASPLAWVAKPYTMAALIDVVRRAVRDLQGKGT